MHAMGNICNGEIAPVFRHLCIKNDLKEEVAKFVAQLRWPSLKRVLYRLKGLIRILEQHWRQRRVSLLAVPGAPVSRAQAFHQSDEICERFRHRFYVTEFDLVVNVC